MEGVGTRKKSFKLRLHKTAANITNVMSQPNLSQISCFNLILGSFEQSTFFGLPLVVGGGYPKIVLQIKVGQNCWKHHKHNVPTKTLSNQLFLTCFWAVWKNRHFLACLHLIVVYAYLLFTLDCVLYLSTIQIELCFMSIMAPSYVL